MLPSSVFVRQSSAKRWARLVPPLLLAVVIAVGLAACGEGGGEPPAADTAGTDQVDGPSPSPTDAGNEGAGAQPVSAQRTISLLRQGLQNVPVNQAMQSINGWQEQLAQQQGASFQAIDDALGQLKNELQATEIDGAAVGELLTQLGEQTRQAATQASGARQQQIQQLGEVLTQAGNQLTNQGG